MTAVNTNDPIELARHLIRKALANHYTGAKRMDEATEEILGAIQHLIQTGPAPKKGKLGVTVMTEQASMRNPSTGQHTRPPREL